MEREIIEAMVLSLPRSEMGTIQEDHEIWEETDGEAYFTVTRHWLPIPGKATEVEAIAATISGPPEERRRIVTEFTEVFGIGTQSEREIGKHNEPDTVLWVMP